MARLIHREKGYDGGMFVARSIYGVICVIDAKFPGELFNFLCVAALLREDHALCGFLNLYFMLLNLRNAEDAMEPALLSATGVFGEKDRVNHRRLYR